MQVIDQLEQHLALVVDLLASRPQLIGPFQVGHLDPFGGRPA